MLSSESMPLRERLLRRLLFWLPKMCFLSQPLAPLLLASDIMTFPLQQMQAGSFLSRINCGLSNTHDKAIDSSWSRRISSTQLLDSYCEWQTAEDLQSHSISVGICRAAVLTPLAAQILQSQLVLSLLAQSASAQPAAIHHKDRHHLLNVYPCLIRCNSALMRK